MSQNSVNQEDVYEYQMLKEIYFKEIYSVTYECVL